MLVGSGIHLYLNLMNHYHNITRCSLLDAKQGLGSRVNMRGVNE